MHCPPPAQASDHASGRSARSGANFPSGVDHIGPAKGMVNTRCARPAGCLPTHRTLADRSDVVDAFSGFVQARGDACQTWSGVGLAAQSLSTSWPPIGMRARTNACAQALSRMCMPAHKHAHKHTSARAHTSANTNLRTSACASVSARSVVHSHPIPHATRPAATASATETGRSRHRGRFGKGENRLLEWRARELRFRPMSGLPSPMGHAQR